MQGTYNKFKIDPNIAKIVNDSLATNYGHAIFKGFSDLQDVKNKDVQNQYNEIKLSNIKDELEDDRNFVAYSLAENKDEFLKTNPFKTAKYNLMGEDYINNLSQKEKDYNVKQALNLFSDDEGNFNREGAFTHLNKKREDGTINEKQYHDITDAINEKLGMGVYAKKPTMADKLDLDKKRAEINKLNSDTSKNYSWIQSDKKDRTQKDPLAKEKAIYNEYVQGGVINSKEVSFPQWYDETYGKKNIKLESITSAKNKLTDQFGGAEQLINIIKQYDDKDFGAIDGIGQKFSELTNWHSQRSARVEANQVALKTALAKALFGGNQSNYEQKMAEQIVGGTYSSETGAATKYKEALNRTIIALQERAGQISRAGYDTSKEQEKIDSYKEFLNDIKDWDGDISMAEYLRRKEFKKNMKANETNQNGIRIIADKRAKENSNNQSLNQDNSNNKQSLYDEYDY